MILGLDGAGKTSIVRRAGDIGSTDGRNIVTVEPTSGFDARTVTVPPDCKLEVWELGGRSEIRSFWGRYVDGSIDGLVWVVDGTDEDRFAESATELANLLQRAPRLSSVPLLVFITKVDRPCKLDATSAKTRLGLGTTRSQRMSVLPASAVSGSGVAEGFKWIVDAILNRGPPAFI